MIHIIPRHWNEANAEVHVSNHDNRGWKDFGKFLYSGTDMTMVDLCWGASLHHALLRLVIGSSEGEDSHC